MSAFLPVLLAAPVGVAAQTDFYNLDSGRPLRVQDALVIEHRALEWQMAPLRVSGASGRSSSVSVEPELAWGVLPRTQVELGLPLMRAGNKGAAIGAAGVDLSILHALNTETLSWPGLALSLDAVVPAGPYGPTRTWATVGAVATRTMSAGRVHLNAAVTPGVERGRLPEEASRWRVGLAADRTIVVHSTLLGAELVVDEPLGTGEARWSAAAGMRRQMGPRSAVDVGLGRRLGGDGEWFLTLGSAMSFGFPQRFGGAR